MKSSAQIVLTSILLVGCACERPMVGVGQAHVAALVRDTDGLGLRAAKIYPMDAGGHIVETSDDAGYVWFEPCHLRPGAKFLVAPGRGGVMLAEYWDAVHILQVVKDYRHIDNYRVLDRVDENGASGDGP